MKCYEFTFPQTKKINVLKAPVNACVKIKNTKTNIIKIVQLNDINQIIKG